MKRFLIDTTTPKKSVSCLCGKTSCAHSTADSGVQKNDDIPGLHFWPNFVDCDTEQCLLLDIDANEWSSQLKRRVQHYGYTYNYKM